MTARCEFQLRDLVKKGMFIEMEIELDEGTYREKFEIDSDSNDQKIILFGSNNNSKQFKNISNNVYTLKVKIYEDNSRSNLLYSHHLLLPSSIDTHGAVSFNNLKL